MWPRLSHSWWFWQKMLQFLFIAKLFLLEHTQSENLIDENQWCITKLWVNVTHDSHAGFCPLLILNTQVKDLSSSHYKHWQQDTGICDCNWTDKNVHAFMHEVTFTHSRELLKGHAYMLTLTNVTFLEHVWNENFASIVYYQSHGDYVFIKVACGNTYYLWKWVCNFALHR